MKRVIILEKGTTDAGLQQYDYLLWAVPPAARQPYYAQSAPDASAWPGASTAENTAISTGAVVERRGTYTVSASQTLTQVRAALVAAATAYQAEVDAYNPWIRYGSTYDDQTGWAAGGAA